MNLLEFKRRLMTDPRDRSAQMREARARNEEFANAAAEADAFESKLDTALDIPVPEKLAENIILEQSIKTPNRWRSLPGYIAAAAAVVLTVTASVFYLARPGPGMDHAELQQHLAWHWQMDGAALHTSLSDAAATNPVERVLGEFGVHVAESLLKDVRISKFCPTPDGAGAHIVLTTEEGPVTLFYMPRTRVSEAPGSIELPNGMQAQTFNLERGSMAVVAEAGRNLPELAAAIERQLGFPPGLAL